MKFGEFTALLALNTETIYVEIEDEPGTSRIYPFGEISTALQDYDILKISTYDDLIRLTLKKGAGA